MPNNFPHPFNDWLKTYQAEKKKLPKIIGQEAINYFRDSFRNQGWTGTTFQKWKKRKGNKDAGRAILIKSAQLRNSLRIVRADNNLIIVASNKPYASAHNEGVNETVNIKQHSRNQTRKIKVRVSSLKTKKSRTTKVKVSKKVIVKAHKRRMKLPQRKFMGDSPYLDAKINRYITALFLRTFK